jgi:hypothetical protein
MIADALHCPTCGSRELSRLASYSSFETHARFAGAPSGKDLVVSAGRARVCLDCGYLLLFVGESERAKVRDLERD